MKPQEISVCTYMLKAPEYAQRKSDKNRGWKTFTHYWWDFIFLANRYSISTAVFKNRSQTRLIIPPQMIMIDVDEPINNVEEKLREYGLHFYKVPSGSNDGDEIDYKWHFFVKLAYPLHKTPSVAKGQLRKFYEELELDGYDGTAVDTARYFAPGGCSEVINTPQWDERVKWCDDNSIEVEGNAYVPSDEVDIAPIYSGSGKQVNVTPGTIDFKGSNDWEPTLQCKRKADGGLSWRLDQDTPITIGNGQWSTAGEIASKLNDGETVSNVIGCPGFNHQHSNPPDTVGYGYVQKKDGITFFNCGGSACSGDTYYLWDEEEMKDIKEPKWLQGGKKNG